MPGEQRIRSYRDLIVWQRAMALAVGTYDLTRTFPVEERFGLSAQLRRAAVSVPANIAEGHGRVHRGEYVHHLSIAHGSLCEVETMLLLAVELRLGRAANVAVLLETSVRWVACWADSCEAFDAHSVTLATVHPSEP